MLSRARGLLRPATGAARGSRSALRFDPRVPPGYCCRHRVPRRRRSCGLRQIELHERNAEAHVLEHLIHGDLVVVGVLRVRDDADIEGREGPEQRLAGEEAREGNVVGKPRSLAIPRVVSSVPEPTIMQWTSSRPARLTNSAMASTRRSTPSCAPMMPT